MQRLNESLTEIQHIMSTNIQDVLQRGEKLEHVQGMSSTLLTESKRFESAAKAANRGAWWKTYGPLMFVALVIVLVIYLKFFR